MIDIPDVFAILFFNSLVRDGWSIAIEPSYHYTGGGSCPVVRFRKDDIHFQGVGKTLDKAIDNARQHVETELAKVRDIIAAAKEIMQ